MDTLVITLSDVQYNVWVNSGEFYDDFPGHSRSILGDLMLCDAYAPM